MNTEKLLEEILKRLVRLETRVTKMMLHLGLNPSGENKES